jgi:hypothetical protein
MYELALFVPREALAATREAVFAVGVGRAGPYERCSWYAAGFGSFLASGGSMPVAGKVGRKRVDELCVETILPAACAAAVVHALLAAYPYEEVASDLHEIVGLER